VKVFAYAKESAPSSARTCQDIAYAKEMASSVCAWMVFAGLKDLVPSGAHRLRGFAS
jgi:hypothetical protein